MKKSTMLDEADYQIRPCTLCAGTDYVMAPGTEVKFSDGRAAIFICRGCGLTPYYSTYPDNVREFLQNDYYNEDRGVHYSAMKTPDITRSYRVEIRQNLTEVDRILPLKGKRLLDVGCGEGVQLDEARKFGATVVGVEPSIEEAARLVAEGVDVHQGLLEDFDAEGLGGRFDIVTVTRVADAVLDPFALLQQIRNLINEDGILHIAQGTSYGAPLYRWKYGLPVPHQKALTSYLPRRATATAHPYYFTHKSLLALLACAGFETVSITDKKMLQTTVNARPCAPKKLSEIETDDPEWLVRYFKAWVFREHYVSPILNPLIKKVTGQ